MGVIHNLKQYFKWIKEEKRGIVLKVTMVRYYIIQHRVHDIEELYNDWFVEHSLYSSHASRDASEVGGAEEILSHSSLTIEEIEAMPDK